MTEGNVFTLSTIAGGGGTPSQVPTGGYLAQVWLGGGGVPHPRSGGGGDPIPGNGLGTPLPPPGQETDLHSEHLLHGGRYASCVYAGGLSC